MMPSCPSWFCASDQAGPGEHRNASWRVIWRSFTPACLKLDDHEDQIRSARAKSWKTSGIGATVHFCCRGKWDGWAWGRTEIYFRGRLSLLRGGTESWSPEAVSHVNARICTKCPKSSRFAKEMWRNGFSPHFRLKTFTPPIRDLPAEP